MRKGRGLLFAVVLLLCSTALFACKEKSKDIRTVEEARSSREEEAAGELRKQLREESVTEIVLEEDVTVMGCLVVKGTKTIRGEGTILLAKPAAAGIYQDLSVLDDVRSVEKEEFARMMETSVLYVDSGAELTLGEHVTVDSAQAGNGIVVCEGGTFTLEGEAGLVGGNFCNLYNEGTAFLAGGTVTGARGYNIINDGTAAVSAGLVGDSQSKGGIFTSGSLTITGGEIKDAGIYNLFVADGGEGVLEGGSVQGAGKANVAVDTAGRVRITGEASVKSGATGILNYGNAEIDGATIEMNLINLQNFGKGEIKDSNIQQSTSNNLVNEETGSLVLTNTNLTNSGGRAITNQKGSISFQGLSMRRAGGEAVYNSGGSLKGEDMLIYGSAGTALDNIDSPEGLGGTVEIKGLEIQTGSGMNVIQESGGIMSISDARMGKTTVTNIKLISGTMNLDKIEIQGTTSTGAGIWTIGGKLNITDSTITSTKGRALALAGGEVKGENLVFEDIVNNGIDGMNHDNGYTSVKAEFQNLTFRGGERENVSVTSRNADITIQGGDLGKTLKNNVHATEGTLTLKSVKIQGNQAVPGETGNVHGVYLTGGRVILEDCEIREPLACAIRNKGGEVTAKNLKTDATPAAAITNAANDSGAVGNIFIDGLTIRGAKLGAVKNECGGTFTVKNGTFGESMANQVMVKDGKMYLQNTVVNRAINSGKDNHHNIYVTGGHLDMKSVTLRDADACGIRQTGGTIEGSDVTVAGAKINAVNISEGHTALKDSSLGLSLRTNVNLTDGEASLLLDHVTIHGAGDVEGNNVNCIYIAPDAKAVLQNGTVVSGSATRAGILCEGGSLTIDGARIYGNATRGISLTKKSVTDEATGAVKIYEPKAVIAHADIYENGNGTVSGGAVYNEGTLSMRDSRLQGNKATVGGAVNLGNTSLSVFQNVSITGNSATGNGGGVHVTQGASLELSGGSVGANTAEKNGDGVRVNSSEFYLTDQAVIASDNDVYLEKSCNIKARRTGIGNTAEDPLHITCTNSNTGTVVVENEDPKDAEGLKDRIVCRDTKGNLLEISFFNQYLVVGNPDTVDWTARIAHGDGTYTSYLSLQDAINGAPTNGELTRIELMRDVTLTAALDIPENGNRNILLTDDGNPHVITRGFGGGRMIILRTGNQLTLEGSSRNDGNPSLILDGAGVAAENNSQIICVGTTAANRDAALTLNPGVRLTGNQNGNGGGAIIVYGRLTMTGGVIDHNKSINDHGGAVYVMATGEMSLRGGTIRDNSSKLDGGAILVNGTGRLTMTGGTIAGNAGRSGGAVTLNYSASAGGTMNMSGGSISDNQASGNAGAVFVHSKASFAMTGGSITGNSGNNGGAVYLHNNADNGPGAFAMTGGAISKNTAKVNGGGVGMASSSNSFAMTGGTISDNRAGGSGTDVYGAGSISMEGTADIRSIYLAEDIMIGLTGTLSPRDTVTEIILGSYPEGRQVLRGDGGVIAAGSSFFAVPQGTGVDLGSDGRLKGNGEAVDYAARIRKNDGTYAGYMTLQAAVDGAATDGTQTRIEIMKDLTLTAALDIPEKENRNILLTDDGSGPYTVTRGFTGDRMIILRTGNQLTIEGSGRNDGTPSLIFDGAGLTAADNSQIICVGTSAANKNASLTLNAGVKLCNNNNSNGGGAVIVYGTMQMNGGVIDGNSSTADHGGALCIMPSGAMTIAGGTISNNSSKQDGGAVIVQGTGKLNMSGGTMTGNTGRSGGAVILNYSGSASGTMTMTGGTIENNTATGNGGAVFVHAKGALNMNGGSITGNSGNNGGAVYLHNNAANGAGSMTMSAGTVRGNTAKTNGGGVGMAAAANTLTMTGGTIAENSASGTGKDIQVAGGLSVKGAARIGSLYLASGKTVALTGALDSRSEKTEVIMSAYTAGTAVLSGESAVLAGSYDCFETPAGSGAKIDSDGRLKSTSAPVDYGARIRKADGSYEGYMTLPDAIAAAATDGTQTRIEVMKDITLTAALDIPENGNRNILLTDDGNGPYTVTRGFTGGRMMILRTGNQLTLEGSSRNDATPSLIFDGANMAAAANQQIICVGTSATNKNAVLTLKAGVKLCNNNNSNGGGAAIVYGTMNMTGGVIDKNKSTNDHGGAVYVMAGGAMTLSGGTISNNSSKNDGGAILVNGTGKLTMTGGSIVGNSGRSGGAVILNFASSAGGTFEMSGGTIKDNRATGNGGAVFVHAKAVFAMTGGSITGNSGDNGGAVYLHYNATNGPGTMNLSAGTISQNTAAKNGGGVGTANGANTLTMTGGSIIENSASGTGRDIHMAGSLSMEGSAQAGGIYLTAGRSIALTGALDSRSEAIEVTMPSYGEGTAVLKGDGAVIAASCQYFKTPDGSGVEIGDNGELKGAAGIVAAVISRILNDIKGGAA